MQSFNIISQMDQTFSQIFKKDNQIKSFPYIIYDILMSKYLFTVFILFYIGKQIVYDLYCIYTSIYAFFIFFSSEENLYKTYVNFINI